MKTEGAMMREGAEQQQQEEEEEEEEEAAADADDVGRPFVHGGGAV